jgi:hypothetical protein
MKGHEYFSLLNEVEQEQFEMNHATCRLDDSDKFGEYILDEYKDFHEFISSAFLFSKTPEGVDYWRTIRDSKRDGVDASHRINGESSFIEGFIKTLLSLEFDDVSEEEPKESLEDVLSNLKIKLSDDKI